MPASGPGKTAPRLIQDLLTYDPTKEQIAGRNLLTSPPPHFDPKAPAAPAVPKENCRHKFKVKDEQTSIARDGEVPLPETGIAAYCSECRLHVDVVVRQGTQDPEKNMMDLASTLEPGEEKIDAAAHHQLHYFRPQYDYPLMSGRDKRRFSFTCSPPSGYCPLELFISTRPPFFTTQYKTLLTNPDLLQKRSETAREHYPTRADETKAREVDGCDFLHKYLGDCLNPKEGKDRIPLLNRNFLRTFGEDCDVIFTGLGFKRWQDTSTDDSPVYWLLPTQPDRELRTRIEDAQHELEALILEFSPRQRAGTRYQAHKPSVQFLPSIETALHYRGYDTRPLEGTRSSNGAEDHPYYAGLGALGDFSDKLLMFSFRCQRAVDEKNTPYYYQCLKDIAIGRRSSELEMYVQTLASEGCMTQEQIDKAYLELRVEPHERSESSRLTDDEILGRFRSLIDSSGPTRQDELRDALRVVAQDRGSRNLHNAASFVITTYGEALSFLGLEENTPDEWIQTMYSMKKEENAATADAAKRAVEIIAEARNSQALKALVETGEMGQNLGMGMDVGEAYALFQIDNRAEGIDLDVLETMLHSHCEQKPENREKYEKAYALIREAEQNSFREPPRPKHPLDKWPVGCGNLGNTCYLNSVLQFLFTIKPLRERVLHCDEYLQDKSPDALAKKKKVGRTEVTVEKVEKAQRFVHHLRDFFTQMIFENATYVTPTTDLAAHALVPKPLATASTKDEPEPAGPTNLLKDENKEPALGTDNEGRPIAGPALPSHDSPFMDVSPWSSSVSEHKSSSPSNKPLGDLTDDKRAAMSKDENLSAGLHSQESIMADLSAHDDAKSDSSTQAQPDEEDAEGSTDVELQDAPSNALQLSADENSADVQKPKLPPRPTAVPELERIAQQQDAAEIMLNIFDLLSCAFKGEEGTTEEDEQWDLIKALFFSATAQHIIKGDTTRQLRESIGVSPGGRDRPLMRALDDEFSKVVLEDGRETYTVIEKPAPVLTFTVRRVIYDPKEKRPVKDVSNLLLGSEMSITPYLSSIEGISDDIRDELRQVYWNQSVELKKLEARQKELEDTQKQTGMTLAQAVEETANYLEAFNTAATSKPAETTLIDVDPDVAPPYPGLPDDLRARAQELTDEMDRFENRFEKLESEFAEIYNDCIPEGAKYRLQAIFIHRGGVASGHYWIYIYDFQNEVWRSYNDERVDEVTETNLAEIFRGNGTKNSTSVVYVREDWAMENTEAVCRRPFEANGESEGRSGRKENGIEKNGEGDVEMSGTAEQGREIEQGYDDANATGRNGRDGDVEMKDRSDDYSDTSKLQVIEGVKP